jgi:hypothetical protein
LRDLVSWVQDSGWPGKHPQVDDTGWSIAQAAALQRLARIRSGESVANFVSAPGVAQLKTGGDTQIALAQDHLILTAAGPDPHLLLLAFPETPTGLHLIVDITPPTATEAQLFWHTEDAPYYHEDRSMRTVLEGGRQTVVLSTPSIKPTGLRFDPGLHAGPYMIHSLELWANPPLRADIRSARGSADAAHVS